MKFHHFHLLHSFWQFRFKPFQDFLGVGKSTLNHEIWCFVQLPKWNDEKITLSFIFRNRVFWPSWLYNKTKC